ncbi:MAG: hypothetical protein GY789_10285 [Hyphomicrobiales bacterium]|nr:hypothetical protein [Hyphomicrobiales bacterium]MCP5001813.1 hypothetical protein [Hyphomicrobiales bacterium]
MFVFILIAAIVAGCTTSNPLKGGQDAQKKKLEAEIDPVLGTKVVQGTCPPILLREGTSYYRKYARGGEDDPEKIVYQAAIADTTRQCSVTGDQMTIQVLAAGRAAAGPAGKSGPIKMPIRVAVVEKGTNKVLYSELTQFEANLPDGTPTTQFLFNDPDVNIPITASRSVRIYVGFDEGPYDKS